MHDRSGTLAASNITKSYGAETILDGASLLVRPGARIGVVGPNRSGKTTLRLRRAGRARRGLARAPSADLDGRPSRPGVDARPDETLLAYLERRTGVSAAAIELDAPRRGSPKSPRPRRSTPTPSSASSRSARTTSRTRPRGFGPGRARPARPAARGLSGGEAARAKLAAILLSRFDVLLLDEPTNDLDFDGLELLERFVSSTPSALVLVSHDRAFLEQTVERVVEFEAETRRIREFAGGWSEYERLREAGRLGDEAYKRYVGERERFEALLRRRQGEARTAGKMADRRGTHALMSKVRSADGGSTGSMRLRSRGRPGASSSRSGRGEAAMSSPASRRRSSSGTASGSGRSTSSLDTATASRSSARTGRKSTLIAALVGALPLASGRRFVGPGIRFGELEQDRAWLDSQRPLVELFVDRVALATGEARTLLAKFALRGGQVTRPAASLSPESEPAPSSRCSPPRARTR